MMTAKERDLELRTRAKDILITLFEKHSLELQKEFEENRKIYEKAFADQIKTVIDKWRAKSGESLEKLKYIVVSALESSSITRTYEFQIAGYDDNIYGDFNPACTYWTPAFIYRYMEEDMRLFREIIGREMIQVRPDEIEEIRKRYVLNYHFIAFCVISGLAAGMEGYEEWPKEGIDTIDILYGAYMEQASKIGCLKGRKEV